MQRVTEVLPRGKARADLIGQGRNGFLERLVGCVLAGRLQRLRDSERA